MENQKQDILKKTNYRKSYRKGNLTEDQKLEILQKAKTGKVKLAAAVAAN